jgi:hypothetical protein
VNGTIVQDNVVIAGLELPNHTFGVADAETSNFVTGELDGLMGLAQSTLSTQKTPTPIESLATAGLVTAPIVSYKLARLADGNNDGEITFGGLDNSKFVPNTLVTLPNVNPHGFWEVNLDSISLNGVDLDLSNRTTILDTGTTLMLIPPNDAFAIFENIPGAAHDNNGHIFVPCNTNLNLTLIYGGQPFTIDNRDMVLPTGTDTCVVGIIEASFDQQDPNQWLLGDTFLKNAYFSTDVGNNQISLAKLRNP